MRLKAGPQFADICIIFHDSLMALSLTTQQVFPPILINKPEFKFDECFMQLKVEMLEKLKQILFLQPDNFLLIFILLTK